MSKEDTAQATEEATHDGAETEQAADTNEDAQQEPEKQYTQSELDSRISMGIKAYIANAEADIEKQRAQDEKIALVKDGEFEALWKTTQAEVDALRADIKTNDFKAEAQGVLVKLGLAHYADALIPGISTIDELLQRAETFRNGIEHGIKHGVKDALDTGKPRIPSDKHTAKPKTPDTMNREEFIEWKRQGGYV